MFNEISPFYLILQVIDIVNKNYTLLFIIFMYLLRGNVYLLSFTLKKKGKKENKSFCSIQMILELNNPGSIFTNVDIRVKRYLN